MMITAVASLRKPAWRVVILPSITALPEREKKRRILGKNANDSG